MQRHEWERVLNIGFGPRLLSTPPVEDPRVHAATTTTGGAPDESDGRNTAGHTESYTRWDEIGPGPNAYISNVSAHRRASTLQVSGAMAEESPYHGSRYQIMTAQSGHYLHFKRDLRRSIMRASISQARAPAVCSAAVQQRITSMRLHSPSPRHDFTRRALSPRQSQCC